MTWTSQDFKDKKQSHKFNLKLDVNLKNRRQLSFGVLIHLAQNVSGCLFDLHTEFKNHLFNVHTVSLLWMWLEAQVRCKIAPGKNNQMSWLLKKRFYCLTVKE